MHQRPVGADQRLARPPPERERQRVGRTRLALDALRALDRERAHLTAHRPHHVVGHVALAGRGGQQRREDGAILLTRQFRYPTLEHGPGFLLELPAGAIEDDEDPVVAMRRELAEELGIGEDFPLEGPIAIAESISPQGALAPRHVVHLIFAGDLGERSLEAVTSQDAAVRGHRLFDVQELSEIPLHPPIQRFLSRWQPGDPVVYLGALWAP